MLSLSIICALSVFVVAIKAQAHVSTKVVNKNGQQERQQERQQEQRGQELYDVVHQYLHPLFAKQSNGFQDSFCHLLDILMHCVFALVILIGAMYSTLPFAEFLSHFLNLLSIVYLLRCLSFNMTVLPQCDFRHKSFNPQGSSFLTAANFLLMRTTQFGYKNDLLFSGHSALFVLSSLMIQHYTLVGANLKLALWLISGVLSLALLCAKKHYSIDVFYAWITVGFIFQNYASVFIN